MSLSLSLSLSLSFLHGSVDFCFVWLCYNLLELLRLFCCIYFLFILLLWVACKRVWLGFWWWTCVMWSQISGKICWYLFFYNWCEIIKAEKERENHILENWNAIHLLTCLRICVLKIYLYLFMCLYIFNGPAIGHLIIQYFLGECLFC